VNARMLSILVSYTSVEKLVKVITDVFRSRKKRCSHVADDAHSRRPSLSVFYDSLCSGRETSIRALEDALAGDKRSFSRPTDASVTSLAQRNLFGRTKANIVQSLKLPAVISRCWSRGRARKLVKVTMTGLLPCFVRLLRTALYHP